MDFWEVVRNRRSCHRFLDDAVEEDKINTILECAGFAPSPANMQPWEFIIIKNKEIKKKIFDSSLRVKTEMARASGWSWLDRYQLHFLIQAPLIVAVVGDPLKTGIERWQEGRGEGYQHACAAAIENMLLAAHALGLGSLWFTIFDKPEVSKILAIEENKNLIALVCLGYSDDHTPRPKRESLQEKIIKILD
jgi:nitroreductase